MHQENRATEVANGSYKQDNIIFNFLFVLQSDISW